MIRKILAALILLVSSCALAQVQGGAILIGGATYRDIPVVAPPTPPVITSGAPGDGYQSFAYSFSFVATCPNSPCVWTRSTGAFPTGLTLTTLNGTTAQLTGSPSAAGMFQFVMQVRDSVGNIVFSPQYTVNITGLPTFAPGEPPDGTQGGVYFHQFAGVGGLGPYVWSIVSGSLPNGVTLVADTLTGTSTVAGNFTFTVHMHDAHNLSPADQTYTVTIQQTSGDNIYCAPGDIPQFGTNDGPATLPTQCYNTSIAATTPIFAPFIWIVNTAADMTNAINNVHCGDIIRLTKGISIAGPFTLPALGCSSSTYITVESSGVTDPLFPAEGTRLTPCFAGVASIPNRPSYPCPTSTVLTAEITVGAGGSGALIITGDHYRIVGLEITRVSTPGIVYSLVNMANNATANHVILDRVWIHGINQDGNFPQTTATATETQRGVSFGQGNHFAVIDSTITDIYCDGGLTACDAQAIGGGFGVVANSGWGVYKIVNNHLEGAAETIMFGGSNGPPASPPGCTRYVNCTDDSATDYEIRRNLFFHPMSWDGNTTTINTTGWPLEKNGFEMKTGIRMLIEGNIVLNTWYSAQPGYAFSIASKNQSGGNPLVGTCPTCVIKDATYRYNYAYNVAYGIAVYNAHGSGCTNCDSLGTFNVSIHDNVIDNLNLAFSGSGTSTGDGYEISADGVLPTVVPFANVSIRHNTVTKAVRAFMILGSRQSGFISNFVFQDNITPNGANDVFHVGGTGTCDQPVQHAYPILQACAPGSWTWDHNLTLNGVATNNWPTDGLGANNFFATPTAAGFVNFNNGDAGNYRLCSGINAPAPPCAGASPYHNQASDGKDPGANIDLVAQYTVAIPQTSLATLTAPSPSGCAANGSPVGCNAAFPGFGAYPPDIAAGAETTVPDPPPGHVSSLPYRSLLYPGANTRVIVHYQPWFCNTSSPNCNSHKNIGYNENSTNTVSSQIKEMIARGGNSIDIDYYGTDPSKSFHKATTDAIATYLQTNSPVASDGTPFTMMITMDKGAISPFCPENTTGSTYPTWSGATTYAIGAEVMFSSISYISLVNSNLNHQPDVSPTQWQTLNTCLINALNAQLDVVRDTYAEPPGMSIAGIEPTQGFAAGGELITITGAGFTSGTTVKFGTTTATKTFVNSTTITATAPAGVAGTATVTLTDTGGNSTSLTNGYLYLATPTTTCNFATTGEQSCSITYVDSFGSETRTIRFNNPSSRVAHPSVVIYYHGAGGGEFEGDATGWVAKSTAQGFIYIGPRGKPQNTGTNTWNAYYDQATYTEGHPPDDTYFTRELIALMYKNYSSDPLRNFLTGFSAGGHGAYRYAVDASDIIAGVGGEATIYLGQNSSPGNLTFPNSTSPVSVIQLHGTADASFPYCGQNNGIVLQQSVDDLYNRWSGSNGDQCSSLAGGNLCTAFGGTATAVTKRTATTCTGSTEVQVYQLLGGIHQYYGSSTTFLASGGNSSTPSNPDLAGQNAIDVFWNFFNAHVKAAPVPGPVGGGVSTWYEASGGKPLLNYFIIKSNWDGTNFTSGANSIYQKVHDHVATYAHPFAILDEQGSFNETGTEGSFAWVRAIAWDPADQFCWDQTGGCAGSFHYLQSFYTEARANPSEIAMGMLVHGFDDSNASWGVAPFRVIAQQCGQVWMQSAADAGSGGYSSSSQLAYIQIPTWNDYEEGTEVETGIDNCYTITGSLAGSTLNWTMNHSDSHASLTTVDHFDVYYGPDATALTPVVTGLASSSTSTSLSAIPSGTWQVYVYMVGKSGIINRVSNAVTFTH